MSTGKSNIMRANMPVKACESLIGPVAIIVCQAHIVDKWTLTNEKMLENEKIHFTAFHRDNLLSIFLWFFSQV